VLHAFRKLGSIFRKHDAQDRSTLSLQRRISVKTAPHLQEIYEFRFGASAPKGPAERIDLNPSPEYARPGRPELRP